LSGGNTGALTTDDVQVLKTGYCINLPRDLHQRSVLYFDLSKKRPETIPSLRIIFFLGQCLMENEATRTLGFVGLYNISNPYAVNFEAKVRVRVCCVRAFFCLGGRRKSFFCGTFLITMLTTFSS
jgi:hypothetical protein